MLISNLIIFISGLISFLIIAFINCFFSIDSVRAMLLLDTFFLIFFTFVFYVWAFFKPNNNKANNKHDENSNDEKHLS